MPTEKINQLKIVHIMDYHSSLNPGVTTAVNRLSEYLVKRDWPTIITAVGESKTPVPEGVEIKDFPLKLGGRSWLYSKGMRKYLLRMSELPGTIFHLHGVWSAPQWLGAQIAFRCRVPAILSPHSMLEPWHWRKNWLKRIKKLIYWHTIAYPAYRHITIIHALTRWERDNLIQYFPRKNMVVIPNAIDLVEADKFLIPAENTEPPIDKPYILFIGRLDPQKGLDILIDAYSRAKNRNPFCLLVVGPECVPQYTKYLKNQVDVLGLKKQVIFVGPVFSNKKWSLYHHAWAFCTPSRSEGLSAVHLEAASARVPVITTYNSGIDELEGAGGLLVRPQVEELAKALEQVFSWDERERNERGLTMRKLIEQHYSWNRVGPQYLNLYTKLFQEA